MHIVLVTHYYPPEVNAPALRAYEHAKVWRERGHEVTIVTAQPSHPYGKIYEGYNNTKSTSFENDIRVLRLKTTLGANAGTVQRIKNYTSFMMAVRKHRRTVKNADVVISTSPQFFGGYSGRFIAKAQKCPWVLEIRDVWPDSILAVGAAKQSLLLRLFTKWVDMTYKQSDHIVSVSPGFDAHFKERGVLRDKISLIPNGFSTQTNLPKVNVDDFPALAPIKNRFIVSYIGTLGMAHSVETLVSAAETLKARNDIGFLIIGSGADRDNITNMIAEKKLENIVMLGQQDRAAVKKLFSLSSASLVHLKRQDVFKTVIPTKLLEGMSMGKPILLGVEGVAKDILDDAKAGLSFEPENANEMASTIKMMVDNPRITKGFAKSGQAYVKANFDREVMAKNYLIVLEKLIAENKPVKA